MSERLVMLDANLIIALYDEQADIDKTYCDKAFKLLEKLVSDDTVKFVTTPLIHYEVLCRVKPSNNFNQIKEQLNQYRLLQIDQDVSDKAIEIYQLALQRNMKLKENNPDVPQKYRLDIFHVAMERVHKLDFKSFDKGIESLKQL